MGLTVLHPAGKSLDALLGTLRPGELPRERPYVIANMVSTPDGASTIGGLSGAIGQRAPGDLALFTALRDRVDAVLTGTSTIASEGYGRLVPTPERRAARVARGLAADPLAVVLSRSGALPTGVPMLDDPGQPVRTFTGETAEPVRALAALREAGIELLLCEGGPTLLGALVRAGLVDELCLTIAPVLAGGEPERTLLGGAPGEPRPLELRWLLEEGGGVHARYAMLAAGPDDRATSP